MAHHTDPFTPPKVHSLFSFFFLSFSLSSTIPDVSYCFTGSKTRKLYVYMYAWTTLLNKGIDLLYSIQSSRLTSTRAAGVASCRRYMSSEPGSATSAMSFKKHLRQRRFGPVPAFPEPSVEEAVSNILYNTPPPSSAPETRHILNCLVQNEPGVLSRVSGILAARGFNIQSLVVANTEVPDLSRMTIVFNGRNVPIEQARRQLEDLVCGSKDATYKIADNDDDMDQVPVWAVLDYTRTKVIERELLLIKVSILGPEHLHEQLPTAKLDDDVEFEDENLNRPYDEVYT